MAKKLSLVKIAKELNVGTSTIVDHLNGHGFEISNKPNAKITDEMYQELMREFQKSAAIKEKADSLIIGTRPKKEEPVPAVVTAAKPEVTAKAPAPVENAAPPVVETPTPPPVEEEVSKPVEEEVVERPSIGLKQVGKVELDSKGNVVVPKKEEPVPEPEPVVEEPVKAEEPVVEAVEPESPVTEEPAPAPEVEESVPEVPEVVAAEPVQEETTPEPAPEKEVQIEEPAPPAAAPVAEEEPAPAAAANPEPEAPAAATPSAEEANTKTTDKDSPKEGAKSSDVIRAEAPTLKGLKVVDRIDLDKFKRPKKKKTKEKEKEKGTAKSDSGNNKNKEKTTQQQQQDGERKKRRRRSRVNAVRVDNRNKTAGAGGGNRGGRGGRGGNRNNRNNEVKEVSKKDIEEQIKQTMARISGGGKKKRQKIRRSNRERMRERQELQEMETETGKLQLTEFVSVSELASLMDVSVTDVIMTCMNLGVIVSINQRLDAEIIELVADEYGHEIEFISAEEQIGMDEDDFEDDPEDLSPRAPIVTVMGHVDHGKTSLLDYIRSANVAEGEAGGITQHIGAYEVKVGDDQKKITFLDTPGHEAFTAMRARGAKVTDVAVIIIAADDRIMPQTKEAISHAQAAGVPIVFAINKIDKDGAQPERIKQELASMNLLVEEWGGKYQSQDISAKTGLTIDQLLEKILLEAELLELKANPDRPAVGAILEASLDKGRGYVAKMLVQAGTLHIGDPIVAGEHSGKIKAMFNERGKKVKEAGPSSPILVLGLSGAPQAGEKFKETTDEQEARQIATKRAQIIREQANRASKRISLDEIGRRLALGTFKELNLIVKGDVDGSIEALSDSLIKLSQETVQVNVIHKAVGQIIESDVLLASASDAIIIGFQVRPSINARKLAEQEGVQIKMYSIIYEAIEEIKLAIEGMLEPTKEEKIVAQVEVREVYKISKVGTVAGCFVSEGKINRNSWIRLVRNGIVVYPTKEGAHAEIASLKRFKDDVKEVRNGMECGISIKNFNDIKVEDVIEAYEIIEIKQTIS